MIVLPHLGVGGAERVAVNLANHWIQEGHSVKLLTTLEHKFDIHDLDKRIKRLVLEKPRRPLTTLHVSKLSPIACVSEQLLQERLGFLHDAQRPPAVPDQSHEGRFRMATNSFVPARQALQQSIDVLLYVPRRVLVGGEPLRGEVAPLGPRTNSSCYPASCSCEVRENLFRTC